MGVSTELLQEFCCSCCVAINSMWIAIEIGNSHFNSFLQTASSDTKPPTKLMSEEHYDYLFKVVLVGDSGVGCAPISPSQLFF